MKYAKLNTEAKIPLIGLGTWKSGAGEVYSAIRWALKLGYTHTLTAPQFTAIRLKSDKPFMMLLRKIT